jgi:hypothetical protein
LQFRLKQGFPMIPWRVRKAAQILRHGDPSARDRQKDSAEERLSRMSWFQRAGHEIEARGLFTGCPLSVFEYTAKDLFCLALMEGMSRTSDVLEVGAGCLRTGYWFIHYLDPGHYAGIEPNARMLDAGRELILGPLETAKSPRFSHNDDFDFGVFGKTFDLVVAFSIWSHASKNQISTMLDAFKRTAKPEGKFLTSWIQPASDMPDYQGASWIGRSHVSDQPGMVAHSPEWLNDATASRGLRLTRLDGFSTLRQSWLVIAR